MSKTLYPGISFSETDLTAVVRTQVSNLGAMCGRFQMGPVGTPVLVADKNDLITNFGIPISNGTNSNNLEDWHNAANYLGYASGLYICRVESPLSKNAAINFNGSSSYAFTVLTGGTAVYIPDGADMDLYYSTMSGTGWAGLNIVAKNPGVWGNDLSVGLVPENELRFNNAPAYFDGYYYNYKQNLTLSGNVGGLVAIGSTAQYLTDASSQTGYIVEVAGNGTSVTVAYNSATFGSGVSINLGQTYAASGAKIIDAIGAITTLGFNTFMGDFDIALGTNEVAISVYYKDVLKETHIVSVTSTAVNNYKQSTYVDNWLEQNSGLISAYYNTGLAFNLGYYTTVVDLLSGTLANASYITDALVVSAMDNAFRDKNKYPIAYLFDGGFTTTTVQNNIVSIIEARKDCFGITSVGKTMPTTSQTAAIDTATTGLKARRAAITASTYAAFYGNFKWQNDPYTGKPFKCSISGDVAGIYARNDLLTNPWWAPSGYNRGGINNVIKLGMNFSKVNQGILHTNQINLVNYDQREGGYYLMSQKTLTGRPSAFSDINVRRLFTYCESAITNAAKAFQWEFNDNITRNNFSSIVNNFLGTVKSRRGLYDFLVVCDTTNNTPDIIDTNQLIMDVYIKPARAIAWITINFTAVRTDASFSELVS